MEQKNRCCKTCNKELGKKSRFKKAVYCSVHCAKKDTKLVDFIKYAKSLKSVLLTFEVNRSLVINLIKILNIKNESFENFSKLYNGYRHKSEKKCKNCKNLFTKTHNSQQYCSEACKNSKKSVCKICSKTYSKKSKYCSPECAAKDIDVVNTLKTVESMTIASKTLQMSYKRIRQILNILKIKNELLEKNRNNYVCNRHHPNFKPIEPRECNHCKKIFKPKNRDGKYCSSECASAYFSKIRRKGVGTKKDLRKAIKKRREMKLRNAYCDSADQKLIALIYKCRPEGYQVDHIMPINKGGLHHQDNLQYLPALENSRKSDRLDYEPQGAIRWQDIININTQLTEN